MDFFRGEHVHKFNCGGRRNVDVGLHHSNNSKITTNGLLTLGGGTVNLNGGSFVPASVGFTQRLFLELLRLRRAAAARSSTQHHYPAPGSTVRFRRAFNCRNDVPATSTAYSAVTRPWAAPIGQLIPPAAERSYHWYSGYTDIAASGSSIPNSAADNVELNSAGGGGNITMGSGATITTHSYKAQQRPRRLTLQPAHFIWVPLAACWYRPAGNR